MTPKRANDIAAKPYNGYRTIRLLKLEGMKSAPFSEFIKALFLDIFAFIYEIP